MINAASNHRSPINNETKKASIIIKPTTITAVTTDTFEDYDVKDDDCDEQHTLNSSHNITLIAAY
jgi:hypothetical protein